MRFKGVPESLSVDGSNFRVLPFDREQIEANRWAGVPYIWHGVDGDGRSNIFATYTVRFKNGNIKSLDTHVVM